MPNFIGDMVVAITGDTNDFNLSIDAAGKKLETLTQIVAKSSTDIAKSFQLIDKEAVLWGNSTDLIKQKQFALKNEMTSLMKQGFDPLSPKIQSLKTQYGLLEKESSALAKSHNTLGNQLKEIDQELGGFGSKVINLLKNPIVLATGAVVEIAKTLSDSVKELINYGDEMHDLSLQTGLTTKALQEYKFVAEQSGGSLSSITQSIKLMTRSLETNADTYKRLGIQIKDSNGQFLSAEEIFDNTIGGLGALKNETEKSNLALKLFGRGALEMVPLLKLGSSGLQELKDKAHSLGLVISDETIKQADKLKDSTKALSESWHAFTMNLVQGSLPILLSVSNVLKDITINAVESRNRMDVLNKGFSGTAAETVAFLGLKVEDLKNRMKKAQEIGVPGSRMSPSDFAVMLQGMKDQIESTEALQREYKKAASIEAQRNLEAQTSADAKKKAEADALERARLTKEYADAQIRIGEQLPLATDKFAQAYQGVLDVIGLANLGMIEQQNIAEETNRTIDETFKSSNDKKLEEIETQRQAYLNANADEVKVEKWATIEKSKVWIAQTEQVISIVSDMMSKISSINSMNSQNQLDALQQQTNAALDNNTKQMESALEAAGVEETTAVQSAEIKLAEAKKSGDAATILAAQNALTKAKIEEDYAKKAAEINKQAAIEKYKIEKQQFTTNQAMSIASATITGVEAVLSSYKTLGWPLGLVPAGIMAGIVAMQIKAILGQVPPAPPALAEGGIVMPQPGGTLTRIAEAGQPEVVMGLDKLAGMLNNTGTLTSEGGGEIHLIVNLDSKPLLDTIFPATQNRTVLIDAGAVVG